MALGVLCWVCYQVLVAVVIFGELVGSPGWNPRSEAAAKADLTYLVLALLPGCALATVELLNSRPNFRVRAPTLMALFVGGCVTNFLVAGAVFKLTGRGVISDVIIEHNWKFYFAIYLLVWGLVVPFVEEVIFRGWLFEELRKKYQTAVASGLSSLIFAAVHLEWITLSARDAALTMAYLFMIGLVAVWAKLRTESLGAPIAFHCGFNVMGILLSYLRYLAG